MFAPRSEARMACTVPHLMSRYKRRIALSATTPRGMACTAARRHTRMGRLPWAGGARSARTGRCAWPARGRCNRPPYSPSHDSSGAGPHAASTSPEEARGNRTMGPSPIGRRRRSHARALDSVALTGSRPIPNARRRRGCRAIALGGGGRRRPPFGVVVARTLLPRRATSVQRTTPRPAPSAV